MKIWALVCACSFVCLCVCAQYAYAHTYMCYPPSSPPRFMFFFFYVKYALALSLLHTFTPHTHAGGLPGDLTCKVTLEETQVILRDCRQADIGRQDTDTDKNRDRQTERDRAKVKERKLTHIRAYIQVCIHVYTQTHNKHQRFTRQTTLDRCY